MSVAIEHVGPWTVDDVLAMPDDGHHTRYELLDGVLLVTPAPAYGHQLVVTRLLRWLAEAGEAASADCQVIVGVNVAVPSGLLIPDICVVSGDGARQLPDPVPGSGVLAAFEVVSPSSHRMDRMIKPSVYAEAGIAIYCRVELEPRPQVVVSTIQDGVYAEVASATAGSRHTIAVPFPITLDPARLLGA